MQPVASRLDPILDRRLWGMRDLAPLFPELTNQDPPIAEIWLTGPGCKFATGPYAGRELADAWRQMPAEWKGTRCAADAEISLLVKFLFPGERPSIQVHPDDAYAAKHEAARGGRGKTEMWHILAVPKPAGDAELLVNLRPGVTPDAFRRAIDDGTLESLIARIPVQPGDTVFLPPGTVHTIGAGLMLCEIMEQSDITYRVYDYKRKGPDGRERPLHVRQALEVINFSEQGGQKVRPVVRSQPGMKQIFFAACPYFATERWEFDRRVGGVTSPGSFELLVILSGSGHIESGSEKQPYERLQVWFLPAAQGAFQIDPAEPTVLLHTNVPDLDAYCRRLAGMGIAQEEWSRVVHP
ncbi:MAG TPA: class I mannose-6-phosphate isomerase [Candidatus Acidoferrales bacterium]|nr:class I mannose-6-phosphate isomerase [Candidatus Acidoferrales bacterium]